MKKILSIAKTLNRLNSSDHGSDCLIDLLQIMLFYSGFGFVPKDAILVESLSFDVKIEKFELSSLSKAVFYQISGRDLMLEEGFCQQKGINYLSGNFENIRELVEFFNATSHPILLFADRFYLDYLHIEKAHYGYHGILILDINLEGNYAIIFDALQSTKLECISLDCLEKAMFSEISYARPNGYYFIVYSNKNCISYHTVNMEEDFVLPQINLKLYDPKYIILNAQNLRAKHTYKEFKQYLSYLRKLSNSDMPQSYKYLEYLCKFNLSSIHTLEYTGTFYRSLFTKYFYELESTLPDDWLESFELLNKSALLWKSLAIQYEKPTKELNINQVLNCFENIINLEECFFDKFLS